MGAEHDRRNRGYVQQEVGQRAEDEEKPLPGANNIEDLTPEEWASEVTKALEKLKLISSEVKDTDVAREERICALIETWEEQKKTGKVIPAEELCKDCPELLEDVKEALRVDERVFGLMDVWHEHKKDGKEISAEELCRDCPELLEHVTKQIRTAERMNALARLLRPETEGHAGS